MTDVAPPPFPDATGTQHSARIASLQAYDAHGLHVVSDVALASLTPTRGGPDDVSVRWDRPARLPAGPPPGDPLVHFELDGSLRYSAAMQADGRCRLRFAGVCEFIVDDLRKVRCQPDHSVDQELTTLLAGSGMLAFLLSMRGHCVLHASAVQIADGAIGLVGASGFGKSTVTAGLCAAGCPLVTDDVLRVEISDTPTAHRGAREIRLRPTARAMAQRFAVVTSRETTDGRLAVRPPVSPEQILPLRALVVPRPDRGRQRVRLEPAGPAAAMTHLLSYPRLLGWRDPSMLRQQFDQAADLARRVPVYVAELPWGPPFAHDTSLELLDRLAAEVAVREPN